MKIAIVGCGFVADYYMQSLPFYPELELAAVTDQDAERLGVFTRFHRLDCARPTLDAVLQDPDIGLVLNLTNPDAHFEISRACLLAGKHVYSEKPLAMRFEDAAALTALADERGLNIACAPCNVLSETAQALWRAVREERVGAVRLVYAEMDDGLVHRMPYQKWLSASGRPWPAIDEFEVGCTLEHAGYYVNWLTAIFGPASSVTAFAAPIYPDKETPVPLQRISPDFSVACIRFASGAVARLTCSLVARRSQKLQLFGDRGLLELDDSWDYRAPVHVRRYVNVRRTTLILPGGKLPLAPRPQPGRRPRGVHAMEFCRGPADLAQAVREQRRSHMPNDYCLHNNEIVLAIHEAMAHPGEYLLKTRFEAVQPMPWA